MLIEEVLQHIRQISCPTQRNGIDSGVLPVMNGLHIFDGVYINQSIFTQNHITTIQNIFPSMLVQEKDARWY